MSSVKENLEMYETTYDWSQRGDEWSIYFGGTEAMWSWMLLPRISSLIPSGHVLEIGPGFGRVTQYLAPVARKITLVDISQRCIESCKQRFREYSHVEYFVNDGSSLDMIEDESIDFVFSWDSMVHAESDVLEAYILHLGRKLRIGGSGFIHHSNANDYLDEESSSWTLKPGQGHRRARSVSAAKFRSYCEEAGLRCIAQELVRWGGSPAFIDCISMFRREGDDRRISFPRVAAVRNSSFFDQVRNRSAEEIRHATRMYQCDPDYTASAQ